VDPGEPSGAGWWVVAGHDIAEQYDLSADPAHASTLQAMLERFWELSNASGSVVADQMFVSEQCDAARRGGFWQPLDYNGPSPPDPLPPLPPPPPPANHSGAWVTKAGRSGCHGMATVASFLAAVLTEICLCAPCSCQAILRRNGRGQASSTPCRGRGWRRWSWWSGTAISWRRAPSSSGTRKVRDAPRAF
jgi:hypothetical protein